MCNTDRTDNSLLLHRYLHSRRKKVLGKPPALSALRSYSVRLVIHLYVGQNGEIGQEQYFKGMDEIAEIYDSSGSERDDLLKNGIKKLEESKNKTEYDMTMEKIEGNMDVGDVVGGRDYLTGASMKKPIGRKIWTISEGKEKIEYKLEGES